MSWWAYKGTVCAREGILLSLPQTGSVDEERGASGSKPNVVWTGKNHSAPDGPPIGVCKTTWVNPLSDAEIDHIDYQSTMNNSAPFLIAITIE